MKQKRALITTSAVAVLGIALAVIASQTATTDEPGGAAPPVANLGAERPFLPLDDLFAEGSAKIAGDTDGPEGSNPSPEPRSQLDDVLEEVLDSDPQLRKFHNLRQKAVRTSAEQQDYFAMISDPELIAAARKDLLDAFSGADVDQGNELRRLQRIQFMNSALAWADNPERAKALEAVTEVVMAALPERASKAAMGSLLGDKFDLFQILMVSDPSQAQPLLATTRGTRSEKVLQLAWSTGSPRKNNNTP
jgi:hypothetical protein